MITIKSLYKFIPLVLFGGISQSSFSQEGFYAGIGINSYAAREEVQSSDKLYEFSHSTTSSNDGFLTQSIGNYGFGIYAGLRKDFNIKNGKNILTIDGQYYYNYQNITLESDFSTFNIKTTANYNHGFRLALGHRLDKIHPYLIIQGIFQNLTPFNSAINSNGIINDVEDDGTILSTQLDNDGGDFSTEVFSFLGGFGIEIPIQERLTILMEYVPMKHVEYGMKDKEKTDSYFVHNLVINQLQIGMKYYIYNPF